MLPIVKFNIYRKVREGSSVNYDGSFGAQCVDLMRHYAEYAEYPPIPTRGNAIELWHKGLGDGYERVYNSPSGVPPIGAIVFWGAVKGNPYGHVAIAGRANVIWMEILEQNGVGTNKKLGRVSGDGINENAIRFRRDFYKNCLGWFIPKK